MLPERPALRPSPFGVQELRPPGGVQVVAAQAVACDQPRDLPARGALRNRDRDGRAGGAAHECVDGGAVAHVAAEVVRTRLEIPALPPQRRPDLEEEAARYHAPVRQDVADAPDAGPARDRDADEAAARAA